MHRETLRLMSIDYARGGRERLLGVAISEIQRGSGKPWPQLYTTTSLHAAKISALAASLYGSDVAATGVCVRSLR